MRISQCVLVMADISGYTNFVTHRAVSLKHAEQIVTELMESIIDRAEHPLVVNKLEGDAALLFAETGGSTLAACGSVMHQVQALQGAFSRQIERIRNERRHCECSACANVEKLKLKFVVHVEEIAIKQVRQFEELAGEGVILIHRLLKNSLDLREYILLTQEFREALGHVAPPGNWHTEYVDGIGERQLFVCAPRSLEPGAVAEQPIKGVSRQTPFVSTRTFQNLPEGVRGFGPWLKDAVALTPRFVASFLKDRKRAVDS
ncbi:MAG: DUF2652 domain-containing protein [Lysobacterales bacterium]